MNSLIAAFSKAFGIDAERITAEVVNGRKRQSDLEQEISMTVQKSENPDEPSPAQLVSEFIQNQTAIEQVQAEIPEVSSVLGKPPPSKQFLTDFTDPISNTWFSAEISGSVTQTIENSPRRKFQLKSSDLLIIRRLAPRIIQSSAVKQGVAYTTVVACAIVAAMTLFILS